MRMQRAGRIRLCGMGQSFDIESPDARLPITGLPRLSFGHGYRGMDSGSCGGVDGRWIGLIRRSWMGLILALRIRVDWGAMAG